MTKIIIIAAAVEMALIAGPSVAFLLATHDSYDRVVGIVSTTIIVTLMTVAMWAAAKIDKHCRCRKKRVPRGIRFYQK